MRNKYDDVTSVDDPLLEGFSLDARKMFVAAAEAKREQQKIAAHMSDNAARQWMIYIDDRINEAVDVIAEEMGTNEKNLRELLRKEMREKIASKPKVILYDPSESLKKLVTEFSADLRAELNEIRRALNLTKKGDVLDLPSLPRRRA